jgi:hypothetical protein
MLVFGQFFAIEFLVNDLELLPQEVLALALVHLVADALIDLLFQLVDLQLLRDERAEVFEPVDGTGCFEESLPSGQFFNKLAGEEIG